MANKNKKLIWIIGGAAVVGYFIYMKRKKGQQDISIKNATLPISQSMLPSTPDQELAPSFVNDTTETIQDKAKGLFSKLRSRRAMRERGESPMIVQSEGIQRPTSLLTKKQARQTARETMKEVRASGGTRKQARQAARSVRKNRMGEFMSAGMGAKPCEFVTNRVGSSP